MGYEKGNNLKQVGENLQPHLKEPGREIDCESMPSCKSGTRLLAICFII